jgi:(1->4)-alpha-D-glucan 1-alpha-D-glucosylmutase
MPTEPTSTYRVHLTPDFGFDAAAAIAPYLRDLGVTHFYASPYLQAAPGSTHGYDVVDHHRANEELGGSERHARLCAALGEAGLGQILDIVPNHMAIGVRQNTWWWDVLENGPSSVYASYFDVVWDPPETKLRNTVLLPVLGDHYGRVLEDGEITLVRTAGAFEFRYYDTAVPVAPRSLDTLLLAAAERVDVPELESVAVAFGKLPPAWATDIESVRERHRDKEVLKARLAALCEEHADVAAAVDAVVAEVNADVDALDALLERQNYRLAYWRTAGQELDYRRFFDINTLIGLRTEDPVVFDDTHSLVLEWVGNGVLDGLRIDHPDGLRDPTGYLRRLAAGAGGAWVVVEKILEPGERLPPSWRGLTAGTTGYDFLNRVGGLFVDPAGRQPLTDLYTSITGVSADYDALVLANKHKVMDEALAADLTRLTAVFVDVCEHHRRYRDYTRRELREVLKEAVAAFPVYRTYIKPGEPVSEADVAAESEAISAASERRPDPDADRLFRFLRDVLLQPVAGGAEAELCARFQQLTGPVMAKGVEDTTFYVFNRLASLNEVGGHPDEFGMSVNEFHEAMAEAQAAWPSAMLATSTHDTKRSEDVRARLALLSQVPEQWAAAVQRWMARRPGPDRNTEYLFWQSLMGAWPWDVDRAVAYMEKAAKEAKTCTSWTDPDPAFDAALAEFVRGVFADGEVLADVESFVAPLVGPGRVNSLAQTLVKLTAPGVPDTYQGSELWDLSLVDPDNRRPVDYPLRQKLLALLDGGGGGGDGGDGGGGGGSMAVEEVLAESDSGLPKLLVTSRALRLRRDRPELFSGYEPVAAPSSVVAFDRGGAVTVAPVRMRYGDGEVVLPGRAWRNVFTGEDVSGGPVGVRELLGRIPVALLEAIS